jgi:hypothetical protein
MPCDYVIDTDRKLVITSGWDVMTGAEALDHQNRLVADKAFRPDFSQLSDFTRVTVIDISVAMAKVLAKRNLFLPQSRRAFVVGQNKPAFFGMIRMFQSYRDMSGEPEQIRIFEDRDEALQWLLDR